MWSAQSDLFRKLHCFQTHLWMSEYFFRVGRRAEGRSFALCGAGDIHDRFSAQQSRSTRRWKASWLAIHPLRRIIAHPRRRGRDGEYWQRPGGMAGAQDA